MIDLTIHLNAKLQPRHRHDLEDAILEALESLGIKADITGGGTAQEKNGEISSCDMELQLADDTMNGNAADSVSQIIGIVKAMLAPVGSKVIIYPEDENAEAEVIPFGVHQGLGLYLNGEDLAPEVYQNYDVNFIYEEIERLLTDAKKGHIASYWEGEETALYLYGESFDDMHHCIQPLLNTYPLCEKCRVVKIA